MKLYVYIDYFVTEHNRTEDGSDESTDMWVERASFTRTEQNFFPPESVEVPDDFKDADKLYLAVVRYHDGDTFNSQDGLFKIGPVFKTCEEAKVWDPDTMEERPWSGYFSGEHWDSVDVWELDMTANNAKNANHRDWHAENPDWYKR